MNRNDFFYVFAASSSKNKFGIPSKPELIKSFESNDTWEHIRYLLEKKYGFHDDKTRKGNYLPGSYFEGRLWTQESPSWRKNPLIKPNEIIKPNDKVILSRKPLMTKDGVKLNRYVPKKYKIQQVKEKEEKESKNFTFDNGMTDDQKINALIIQANKMVHANFNSLKKIKSGYGHASEIETMKPPPGYICHRCGLEGHFKNVCPTLKDKEFIPVNQRKMAYGIPSSYLKHLTDEEVKQSKGNGVMITSEGKYVKYKQNDIFNQLMKEQFGEDFSTEYGGEDNTKINKFNKRNRESTLETQYNHNYKRVKIE